MRRRVAFVLSVVMLIAAVLPIQVFAQRDLGLEEVLQAVKAKLPVPDSFSEFDYNISNQGDRKVWCLDWHSKDYADGSMCVSIDNKGRILEYNIYRADAADGSIKLPKVSTQEAGDIAEDFIKNIDPALPAKLRIVENPNDSRMGQDYRLYYIRVENGIPFYSNTVRVNVNARTGEVSSYWCNWLEDITFPAADNIISEEKAQEIYKDKLGLELVYKFAFDGKTIKPYAAYCAKYDQSWYIDAVSGERINADSMYGTECAQSMGANMMLKFSGSKSDQAVSLTPEELKAVDKDSALKTQEEAERISREFKTLELTDDFKFAYSNLSRDWQNKEEFIWELSFFKQALDKSDISTNVYVRINALTGEIKSFYINYPKDDNDAPKYDANASKQAAEEFLKEVQPDKFSQSFFDDKYAENYVAFKDGDKPGEYRFRYCRKVNGLPFRDNSMVVRYDAVRGKIIGFEMTWFNADFPSADKVLPIDKVYEAMFEKIGLELQYAAWYSDNNSRIMPIGTAKPSEIKPVYGVKQGKPVCFDPNSGEMLNYDGQPYKETKPVEYSDISGHFAEKQIRILSEFGISLEGKQFRPDESILQKDFLGMVSKTLNYYAYDIYSTKDDNKAIEEMYKTLVRQGVIKECEKQPEKAVTREEAVKYIIRALKFDKVAEIKGIFNCTFKDADAVDSDLLGYVAIAQGLGIVNGHDGYFNPKAEITRGQAAMIIYNYLQK